MCFLNVCTKQITTGVHKALDRQCFKEFQAQLHCSMQTTNFRNKIFLFQDIIQYDCLTAHNWQTEKVGSHHIPAMKFMGKKQLL